LATVLGAIVFGSVGSMVGFIMTAEISKAPEVGVTVLVGAAELLFIFIYVTDRTVRDTVAACRVR
jgi:hypothetical protein